MPISGPQLKQVQGEIFRGYVGLLLSDQDARRTVSLGAENTLHIASKEGDAVDVKVDPAPG